MILLPFSKMPVAPAVRQEGLVFKTTYLRLDVDVGGSRQAVVYDLTCGKVDELAETAVKLHRQAQEGLTSLGMEKALLRRKDELVRKEITASSAFSSFGTLRECMQELKAISGDIRKHVKEAGQDDPVKEMLSRIGLGSSVLRFESKD
jgi:hypothetical protein